jgi:hypothetical protein
MPNQTQRRVDTVVAYIPVEGESISVRIEAETASNTGLEKLVLELSHTLDQFVVNHPECGAPSIFLRSSIVAQPQLLTSREVSMGACPGYADGAYDDDAIAANQDIFEMPDLPDDL